MSDPRVLYRDEHLLALDKPSGMLVHRGWDQDPVVALDIARRISGRLVHPVHRLDRGTSGVLLFALDAGTAAAVQRRFVAGDVRKRYLALVRGVPPDRITVDHPVPRAEGSERVAAVTDIERVATVGRFSLVVASPHTGRFHQVRRHLKHLSCPVVGDANYGKGEINRLVRAQAGLARLALHAAGLAFEHPMQPAGRVEITAPLPPDLREPFEALGFARDLLDALELPGTTAAFLASSRGDTKEAGS